jgi:hypothetical protein
MRAHRLLAVVLCVAPSFAWGADDSPRAHELRFAGGTLRIVAASTGASLSPPAPDWFAAEAVPSTRSARGRLYLFAVAPQGLSGADQEALRALGAEILDYIPAHGYRLRVAPAGEHALRAMTSLAWLGEAPAHLKVAPELLRRAGGSAGASALLRVVLASDEPPGRALDILRGLDVVPAPSGKDGAWRIDAVVPAQRLRTVVARLASLPEVEAIEPKRTIVPFNQDAVWVHQSFIGPSPQSTPVFDQGIFGCGQIVASADTGQDYGSCFFEDAVNGPPPVSSCAFAPCPAATPAPGRRKDILYYNWSGTPTGDDDFCPAVTGGSGHGTHTTGSIAGDSPPYADCAGFSTPARNGGDGLAPGAKLVMEEMGDGFEYLNDRGGTLWNLTDVAFQNGARIHSNSWGGACFDALGNCQPGCTLPYDSFARDADLAMWSHPDLLVVAAAGNAGGLCPPPLEVGMPANAKSVLAVGALPHGAAATAPSSFTSAGPVADGRLKPEIAAQGESTVSAASDADVTTNNCDTCTLDGTSMAAPTIAGLAALIREYYASGFLAAGTRAPAQGLQPSGALVKATLLDGAVALGAQAPAPDFFSGYGRALLAQSLPFAGSAFKMRVVDQRSGVVTGSVVTRAYDVAAGTPLRATLVWSDYPASLTAATARVNELRLEVVDPSGTIWFQKIDPASGLPVMTGNPADAHDALNTSERFVFPNPVAGRWAVRVVGADVPMGPQPFALVVHGDLTDCPAPASPGAPVLTTPADHQAGASWAAVPGAAAYNVYRALGACPGGAFVLAASGVTGTSFTDSGLSGGTPYAYVVTAASDATARCESPPSACAQTTPTGDCTLAPQFAGAAGASSPGTAACGVTVSWSAGAPYCVGDVRYNVYRSADPAFTPGPGNRIARCVVGTTWNDGVGLLSGATYFYIVRSEDATTGHGGPCRGGNEDTNLAIVSAVPIGPKTLGTWRDDGGDTTPATMTPAPPWGNDPTGGATGPRVWSAQSDAGVCSDLTSPVLTVGSPALGPLLSFATRTTLEYDPFGIFGAEGSLGQVEIAAGPSFTGWTRLPLSPDYPALVEFPVNDCDTTQNLDTYFSDTAPYATYSASLANWGGSDVKVRFHLSGDYLYPSGGWWVDDVQATQVLTPGACTTSAAGPPPIPDAGAVPGQPVRVAPSGPASSGPVTVTWDATRCPAASVNLYWGALGNGTTFTGGVCGLSPTGSANVTLPNNVWFVLAATDGASTDGSYARDLSGAELNYSNAGAVCPAITAHSTNNGCP